MSDNWSELDRFRSQVHRNLALGSLADGHLEVTDDDGRSPVIVALDEERLAVLLKRVENAGGYANVFVKTASGVVYLAVVNSAGAIDPDAAEDLGESTAELPDPHTTVGMFVEFLRLKPNGVRLPVRLGRREQNAPVVRTPQPVALAAG